MGLLEKLRPQPRWKHGDPAVRAAAVYEIGPQEGDALVSLAREDSDPRVRRAAVSRLSDPGVLGDVGRTDPDEDVRAEAIRNLAALAVEARDAAAAVPVLRQLAELGRTKEMSTAAKSAASPAVRSAAVDLLPDARSIGSVSRHAVDGATRLRALERLTDAEEIAAVALKSEHTDAAIAALEADQIDAIVVDLPTAFFITAAQMDNGTIVGQIEQPADADAEYFSVVLPKDSPLTVCVNQAIAALQSDDRLDAITREWLSDKANAPVFQP